MPDAPAAAEDRFVALFRAVNVGGHGQVPMADLRAMAARIGLGAPQTMLQSGNLIFEVGGAGGAALEQALEDAAAAIGLKSDVMVRSAAEWAGLMADNPFEAEARDDPSHLILLILKAEAGPQAQAAVDAAIKGRERVVVARRAAYVHYADGIGRSKLTTAVLERQLGTRVTGRNWRTVCKIAAAVASPAGLSA